jgi:chemotaxis signal transduction protein
MPETPESANNEKHLIFSIFDRLYSFPADIIGEVANCNEVYPLPLLPSCALGFINRYSVPYVLYDIGFLLFNKPGPRKEALVIKSGIDRVAFSIDNVSGIADIAPDSLLKIETGSDQDDLNSAACASFKWHGGDVFVLDIGRVLARVSDGEVQ